MMRLMLAVIIILAAGTQVRGQGLADAAKRAEEQRESLCGPVLEITIVPEPAYVELKLTRGVVQGYSNARLALASLWKRNVPLYERVRAGGRGVERLRDFSNVLAVEPIVVELLKFYNFTPESFVLVELSLRLAAYRASGAWRARTDLEKFNTDYFQSDEVWIQVQRHRWYREEAGFLVFPEWVRP